MFKGKPKALDCPVSNERVYNLEIRLPKIEEMVTSAEDYVSFDDVSHLNFHDLTATLDFPEFRKEIPYSHDQQDRILRKTHGNGEISIAKDGKSATYVVEEPNSSQMAFYIAYYPGQHKPFYMSIAKENHSFSVDDLAKSEWRNLIHEVLIAAWLFRHNELGYLDEIAIRAQRARIAAFMNARVERVA